MTVQYYVDGWNSPVSCQLTDCNEQRTSKSLLAPFLILADARHPLMLTVLVPCQGPLIQPPLFAVGSRFQYYGASELAESRCASLRIVHREPPRGDSTSFPALTHNDVEVI